MQTSMRNLTVDWYTRFLGLLGTKQPLLDLGVTAGAESGGTRRFTLQVKDSDGNALTGRYLVEVWISTSQYGAPAGTQTVSNVAGTVITEYTANQAWLYETDSNGNVQIDVNLVSSGSRYVNGAVVNGVDESGAITWILGTGGQWDFSAAANSHHILTCGF